MTVFLEEGRSARGRLQAFHQDQVCLGGWDSHFAQVAKISEIVHFKRFLIC